jgi:hypothetical protein
MRGRAVFCFFAFALSSILIHHSLNAQKTYPVVIEIKDGIKTITNPEYPRDGRFVAKLTLEMTCGEEGGVEAATLNRPLDLRVDDHGNIYVMDLRDGHIKVYDDGGKFVRTIGRQGQGPGEFGAQAWFDLMSKKRVCILDSLQSRVMFLTTEGKYISMFSLEGYYRSVAVDEQDRIYLAKWGAVEEPKLSSEFREIPYLTSIFRTDMTGKNRVHLTDFQGETEFMKAMGQGVVGFGGIFMIVWNVSRDGRLYGGYNEEYAITAYGPDDKPEFAFGRAFKRVKNTRFKGPMALKKYLPVFGRSNHTILFDEDGNVWIELYKDDEKKNSLYDVFSPEGIYLKQVKIEQRIFQLGRGKIYSIVESEEGFLSVKRFAIVLVPESRQ